MMSMDRRVIITIVAFLASLPLLGFFILAILVAKNSQSPAFDDSDLAFIRPEIPAESNAFDLLLQATNATYWPKLLDERLEDLYVDTNWDDALAADALAKNRDCLGLFDQALQQPFLLVPE